MSSKTIFLIRHGTPDWSRKDIRYDIPPGPPLVAQGRSEARLSGVFLQTRGVQAVYASPMERAAETASIVAEVLGLPVRTAPALTEWVRDETSGQLRARLLEFWQRYVEEGEERTLALVTHGGPIETLVEYFEPGIDLSAYRARFDHRNCVPPAGIWQVKREAPGRPWRCTLVFTPVAVPQVAQSGIQGRLD